MNFDNAIRILNTALVKKNPTTFNSSWIIAHAPAVYRYIHKHVRTTNDEIDWDAVIVGLDRPFQSRWTRHRRKRKELLKLYRSKAEVEAVKKKYQDKLHTFIAYIDADDKVARDRVSIALVRLAQKGNITAQEELTDLLTFTIENGIERYWFFSRWKYHRDSLGIHIEACMRRYRFTGSFIKYLFVSLAYASRGLKHMKTLSLDVPLFDDSGTTLADSVVQDADTGEVRLYDRSYHSDAAH